MAKYRIISAAQLREAGACSEQVELFEQLFGDRTRVTVAKAVRVAGKFDFEWAGRRLLSLQALAAYNAAVAPARAAYDAARAQAWDAYNAAVAQARAAYDAARAQAWAAYSAAVAQAQAAYDAAVAPAQAAYDAAVAQAWAEAYIADKS